MPRWNITKLGGPGNRIIELKLASGMCGSCADPQKGTICYIGTFHIANCKFMSAHVLKTYHALICYDNKTDLECMTDNKKLGTKSARVDECWQYNE